MALAATFSNKHSKLPTEIFLAFIGICLHLPTSLSIPGQACKNGWQVAKKIGMFLALSLANMAIHLIFHFREKTKNLSKFSFSTVLTKQE